MSFWQAGDAAHARELLETARALFPKNSLLEATEKNLNDKLARNSFQAGIPKQLFETPLADFRRNRYDVTPDGKRFLVNVLVDHKQDAKLTVIVNWPALLKH